VTRKDKSRTTGLPTMKVRNCAQKKKKINKIPPHPYFRNNTQMTLEI
jgi:hypothetical protein